jgi:riboflavin biosynthesis pyrimidine reductase
MTERFEDYCRRREQSALAATIPGYSTRADTQPSDVRRLENDWSRALFDGPFYRSAVPALDGTPISSLVFVQSRDGNTGAADPSTLGGGETDLHLIYEGLSRVDADAVMAGATTARARDIVFSVWHPQLTALRQSLGHGRHPAQVVVTERAELRFEDGLMFNEPALRVFVITRTDAVQAVRKQVAAKPWIEVIDAGVPASFQRAFRCLYSHGIRVMSCVGGRRTATALLDERLVSDIYLTTSTRNGGEPNTPFYEGSPLPLKRIVLKDGRDTERGVTFEHFRVSEF